MWAAGRGMTKILPQSPDGVGVVGQYLDGYRGGRSRESQPVAADVWRERYPEQALPSQAGEHRMRETVVPFVLAGDPGGVRATTAEAAARAPARASWTSGGDSRSWYRRRRCGPGRRARLLLAPGRVRRC